MKRKFTILKVLVVRELQRTLHWIGSQLELLELWLDERAARKASIERSLDLRRKSLRRERRYLIEETDQVLAMLRRK